MAELLSLLSNHLNINASQAAFEKNPDDVVIIYAKRTPMSPARRGAFKDLGAMDLLYYLLKNLLQETHLDPIEVNEITIGNCLLKGSGAVEARAAAMAAGFPHTTTVHVINRLCSSGLTAVNDVANAIKSGDISIGIGGGAESMTKSSMSSEIDMLDDIVAKNDANDNFMPMGITAENVAEKFNISREDQDDFAAKSFQKAEYATKNGYFRDEIVKIPVKSGQDTIQIVEEDKGIRFGVSSESLQKLKPSFKKTGSVHAGNSSQMTDGAAIVLIMKRSKASELGLTPIGKYLGANVVGVPPNIMGILFTSSVSDFKGIGPIYAIPKVLTRFNLCLDDIDVVELNEAFASQALYCVRQLKINPSKLNPWGGAIALGATGARQIATLLNQLRKTEGKIGCTSMCIGTGMGMASIIIAE